MLRGSNGRHTQTIGALRRPFLHLVLDAEKVTVLKSVPLSTQTENEMKYALILIVYYLAIVIVAKWSVRAVVALALITVAVSAFAADVPNDANWPSMSEPSQPVLFAYNPFGQRIVLFANFCAGDASRRDHMHTYGVYDSHNQFIQGGCWKFDPLAIRKTKTIEYFDLGAYGWDKWSLHSFRPVKALNVKCRGESGDKSSTWQACNERDAAQFN